MHFDGAFVTAASRLSLFAARAGRRAATADQRSLPAAQSVLDVAVTVQTGLNGVYDVVVVCGVDGSK